MVPRGGVRTTDTAIFSRMLYQLSYLGAGARAGWLAQCGAGIKTVGETSLSGGSSSSSGGGPGMA